MTHQDTVKALESALTELRWTAAMLERTARSMRAAAAIIGESANKGDTNDES